MFIERRGINMKVLYISYLTIFSTGGAPIEASKFYNALKYCKSKIEDFDFKVISMNEHLNEKIEGVQLFYSKKDAIKSRLLGHCYYMYMWWKHNKKIIMSYNPDVVILGRSNLGFIAKDLRNSKRSPIIVTDIDNVEYDYINAFYVNSLNPLKKFANFHLKTTTFLDEQQSVKHSDFLFFLTSRNQKRIEELYKDTENKMFSILPICIPETKTNLKNTDEKMVVFYGTLSYEANHESIMWFIDKVWKNYFAHRNDIHLIIAGKSPKLQLINNMKETREITLNADYKEFSEFVKEGALVIAPLLKGAGMKTKIAEALEMGLLVVSSDEGLVGYEECASNEGVWKANKPEEYIDVINKYISYDTEQIAFFSKKNIQLFKNYYSQDRANKEIENVLKKCEQLRREKK